MKPAFARWCDTLGLREVDAARALGITKGYVHDLTRGKQRRKGGRALYPSPQLRLAMAAVANLIEPMDIPQMTKTERLAMAAAAAGIPPWPER